MGDFRKVLCSVDGGVGRITLNRPDKRNALDDELIGELHAAFARLESEAAVGAVVLAGAGKDFCSGADLAALQRTSAASVMENIADARRLGDLFIAMRRFARPIVAVVQGRALAGGCGLATAADMVFAAQSAQFGYPEVRIGFVPAMVMAILRRSVSEKRAFEVLVSGEVIAAQTALEIGMINRVLPDNELETEAERYVAQLATRSSSAAALTKSLLYQIDAMAFEAAINAGIGTNALARQTEDYRRGIEQFLKKK